jgi:SNW domain-containing protein 1
MQTILKDPLEVSRFKHKRIPKGPGSPPPIMMRSPPRKLTVKDQLDWKIPPCISNWKNAKGYTIPLEMRLSADGRTLQHHTVNAKFAQLTDGLYIAERQSRKELEERNKIMKSIAYKE